MTKFQKDPEKFKTLYTQWKPMMKQITVINLDGRRQDNG
jgi:hypothetical protein